MKLIWAPWRIEYILSHKEDGCFLCKALQSKKDDENYVLFRGERNFVILNKFPYNSGHLMIAPNRHISDITMLDDLEQIELMKLLNLSVCVLNRTMSPHGFNIGINLGEAAGAGLKDHLHVHVVPRWRGDTNFMPILSEVKIIPQHIKETYEILLREFRQIGG